MCYPSPPPFPPQKGKTGGLARSRGFRARTMDTTRPPPSKPATLLARHVVRKRNFLEAFAKLRETDATTRIHRAECGYIYGCASQEIKRATFLAFYRSSTMAARACPEFSPRIVSPRQVSGIEDRASLPFRSNYYPFYIYIYISHIFLRVLSWTIIFQDKLSLYAYLYHQTIHFSYYKIYIRNKINNYSIRYTVLSQCIQKSSKYIYLYIYTHELIFRRAFDTHKAKQTIILRDVYLDIYKSRRQIVSNRRTRLSILFSTRLGRIAVQSLWSITVRIVSVAWRGDGVEG